MLPRIAVRRPPSTLQVVVRLPEAAEKRVAHGEPWRLPTACRPALPGTHGVDGGVGVDLQHVAVVCGVLEEPVVRIQHFVAQQIKPLPRETGTPQGRGRHWLPTLMGLAICPGRPRLERQWAPSLRAQRGHRHAQREPAAMRRSPRNQLRIPDPSRPLPTAPSDPPFHTCGRG